jgi:hypothetical protein
LVEKKGSELQNEVHGGREERWRTGWDRYRIAFIVMEEGLYEGMVGSGGISRLRTLQAAF